VFREVLRRADADVHTYSSHYRRFHSNWAFIITWDDVGYYGAIKEGKQKVSVIITSHFVP
jgi:hypothetical protein